MHTYKKGLLVIIALIALTTAALAVMGPAASTSGPATPPVKAGDGPVTLTTQLAQDKVLKGSPGQVAMAVTLTAARLPDNGDRSKQAVDLVIVLDRSGSMEGQKIDAARRAVLQLLDRLTPADRLALVTYSDGVQLVAPLTTVNQIQRNHLGALVNQVYADGSTNLGGGLHQGITLFLQAPDNGRQRKVILISDGLANQGITDPNELGRMSAAATDHHFSVSTLGVGLDFNELLMTTIADQGTGRYYFLEDPLAFAQVFEKEFQNARQIAASDVEIRLPLAKGVRLVDAGGYPIKMDGRQAVIFPGSLVAGGQRKLFLTFQVATDQAQPLSLGKVQVRYQREGKQYSIDGATALTVACVPDQKEVLASVDKDTWGGQVVQEEYNQLKEEVADAVRKGNAPEAQKKIQEYEARNRSMNATVGSAVVADHLEKDVKSLRQKVTETFAGPPAAVAEKQKKESKALQYESYEGRRDKK